MTDTQHSKGLVFTLVGPGGAGKNALMKGVLKRLDDLKQLATATTRPAREEELHGREHLFVSKDEFERMIAEGELLEWQEVTADKFYGIPRSIKNSIDAGQDLIADIEVRGARILREAFPDAVRLIFITVPGDTDEERLAELEQRMLKRDENTPDDIAARMKRARELELPFAPECDEIIINDDLERAGQELYELIVQTRKNRCEAQPYEHTPHESA